MAKYVKGQSGNPKGKPKGSANILNGLLDAVKRVEKKEGKNLLDHFVERSFMDDKVLIALMKKLIPDKKELIVDPENPLIVQINLPPIKEQHGS